MFSKQNNGGLYDASFEHDACGIGFVANINGHKSHQHISDALTVLENMEHRGACGCENNTGDGAGILIQIPHEFFFDECIQLGKHLPNAGKYGVGMIFFPKSVGLREECRDIFNRAAEKLGLDIIAYRKVPVNKNNIGPTALSVEPCMEQVFVACPDYIEDQELFERKLFILRNYASHTINNTIRKDDIGFYMVSLSSRTIIYKGQLTSNQVRHYFTDLSNKRMVSAFGLVHSRFATNTFPSWKLAQPFRYIAHNGEINTLQGNLNWLRSSEKGFTTPAFPKEELDLILPIVTNGQSDSACLDNMIELLTLTGRSLPHVMMMLIPEAWDGNNSMDPVKKAFYEYHACLMEPWDGPASISFTNGQMIGATLDRNGLRPSRYTITHDNRVIMASETGVLPIDPANVKEKGRLQPGKMFVVDMAEGRIISDEELKQKICSQKPYAEWLNKYKIRLEELPEPRVMFTHLEHDQVFKYQKAFGYSTEDLDTIIAPMAIDGKEPIGSMGNDAPLAVLSNQPQHLSAYFKQLFAQVTNPPIDPIREKMVMSLATFAGSNGNLLVEEATACHSVALQHPILNNHELEKIRSIDTGVFQAKTLQLYFKADGKAGSLKAGLERLCRYAVDAVQDGFEVIILTDRAIDSDHAPIPSLLATAAVHHHLIKKGYRGQVGLIVEAGDVWETHHFACLIGFGATAINPYLALSSIRDMKMSNKIDSSLDIEQLKKNYIKAVNDGLLKVFSKMGISTLQSYQGAQIFEIIGINSEVVNQYFTGATSRIEGMGLDEIARETLAKHFVAFSKKNKVIDRLPVGGVYQWKRTGEFHLFNPQTIHLLQDATKRNDYATFKKYSSLINHQSEHACTLRSQLEFVSNRPSISIDEVEPAENIYKRFATGAMSFGSVSWEAHTTLAIAMNRLGGKSNTGEGGEDEIRYTPLPNGDSMRSAIKQVASARFGVTALYLTEADEIQIKMAQGAKPGEGGQLPGHKVDEWIGKTRHATPGVGLISPPPHHDIYSIEDLAQLIFDLKNANRAARINVKLVSKAGVGTIAAGVVKAKADVVLIAGHDGGTGASPISSVKHAGLPWELGLAETHQTLVKNKLRSRVIVQADGQMKTGKDIAMAALLGAEEWGVATAALIVEGCIMMRKCHLNTCPVGVATQDETLRKRFTGDPNHVVNFFKFITQELREIMAELGFRTVNEMIGQTNFLQQKSGITHWKYNRLDLSKILYKEPADEHTGLYAQELQDHGLAEVLDWKLLTAAKPAIENVEKVFGEFAIVNTDRTVGTIVSNEITKIHKSKGLPEDSIHFKFKGTAGQSFGAFNTAGIKLELEGDANDYFGKGLSGAKLIVYPDIAAPFIAEQNSIIGNVALYGATSGEAYIRGKAGERFAVRNSGAKVVVEGIGDHGCEYMTGGVAVILGNTGRNFAAGMSGGIAYVYDTSNNFAANCNLEMVELDPLDETDAIQLKAFIQQHFKYTNSSVAAFILKDFDHQLTHFIKVFPTDYKKVLAKKKSTNHCFKIMTMGKPTGFLEFERATPAKQPTSERVLHYKEFVAPLSNQELNQQSARCMNCGVPFCHNGCPLGNIIPEFNDAVYKQNWAEAYEILSATNNFPEFTGRICPAPCESACVLGINQPPVAIEEIEKHIIEIAFEKGLVKPFKPITRTGKTVAVIGSGPAGLAAAAQLNYSGHLVTVFERDDAPGGLLRYGIPDFKLEKWVIDRRIQLMEAEGIVFKCNVNVGVSISINDLLREYSAIVLAGGATIPRDLTIEGRHLNGVHFAMDYLKQQNKRVAEIDIDSNPIIATNKNVVVIGGGDTGSDCIGTANRQKATSITQFELMPKPSASRTEQMPWPQYPFILKTTSSHEEGANREWAIATKKFIGDENGNLKALVTVQLEWKLTESGKTAGFVEIAGTEKEIPCELALLAMGFANPQKEGLLEKLEIELDERGNVKASDKQYQTNIQKVFAAGDMRRGQSLVVWAISEGRACARKVDEYFGESPTV